MTTDRGVWKSNVGFVLAAVGSAVGLGNLWGFAYSASRGGGATFVVLYLLFVFIVGVPVMMAELAVGRHTGLSPILALRRVGGEAWKWLGVLFVFVGFGILSFYAVIMGWTGRMLVDFIGAGIPADTGQYFGEISEGWWAIVAHLLGMALTIAIVTGGIRRGIERVAVVLMPLLFVLIVGLAIWAATLSGSGPGYEFYLKPELGELFQWNTITGAAGQAFFSLSLGMGAMITYASYLKDQGSIPAKAGTIAISDTLVAFVGGLVTFPIIFHFALQADVSESTIGALFIAVPRGFISMGGAGWFIGTIFFLALYIAALTSAISLLEVVVSACIDSWGWPRKKVGWIAGAAIAAAGIPSALDSDLVGFLFELFGQVFLIFGGLMLAILLGWVWTRGANEEVAQGFPYPGLRTAWIWTLRTVIPVVLGLVLYFRIKEGMIPAAKTLLGG